MALSPKLADSMAQRGGRHYTGRRLYGPGQLWACPACGLEQTGRVEDGCQNDACGAGRPTAAPHMRLQAPQVGRLSTRESNLSPAEQLRHRREQETSRGVDLDQLEQRIAAVLDAKLASLGVAATAAHAGFSPAERFALLEGLRTLITLIELGDVQPPAALMSLPELQALAQTLDDPSFYDTQIPLDTPNTERTDPDGSHARTNRPPSGEDDQTGDTSDTSDTGDAADPGSADSADSADALGQFVPEGLDLDPARGPAR